VKRIMSLFILCVDWSVVVSVGVYTFYLTLGYCYNKMGVSRFFSYPIQLPNFNNLYKKSILIMQKVDWNWQYLLVVLAMLIFIFGKLFSCVLLDCYLEKWE
jgi:hypothetical protein